jgi:TrmH family RNA methyltransferase
VLHLAAVSGVDLAVVFTLDRDAVPAGVDPAAEIVTVSDSVLRRLSGTEHPRGPVAVAAIPESAPLTRHDTVVLVDVGDPGNAGTILRSAAAFGFHVASTPGTVDLWSPKVLRSAAGAHFQTEVASLDDDPVSALGRAGLTSVALVVAGGEPIEEVHEPVVGLLVGSEAHGLDATIAAGVDRRVTLAMPGGTESLNAAVAASIAMYALRRR